MLRPSEAAVVAHVDTQDVNRAIDEHILPEGFFTLDEGRRVTAAACSLIEFYFDSAKRLTAEERLFAIRETGARLHKFRSKALASLIDEDWRIHDEFLTIDLSPFVKRTKERMERLAAARDLVHTDPEVLGGTPVVRGTRIPVYDVASSLAAGLTIEKIINAYPSLDKDKIELAHIYAKANPLRGRPKARDTIPAGTRVIEDRKIPHRRKAG